MAGKRDFFISLILIAFFSHGLFAQTTTPTPTPTPSPSPTGTPPPGHTPEPYTKDEFPQWLADLRHAEIIFFGSLPVSFLFAFEGVEIGRYIASGEKPEFSPWPVRSASPPAYTTEEQFWIVGSAVVISAVIALVDFIIGQLKPHSDSGH
jgi:hypothetical protein